MIRSSQTSRRALQGGIRALAPCLLALLFAVGTAGCDSTEQATQTVVPEPQNVAASTIAEPVQPDPGTGDEADGMYYFVFHNNGAEKDKWEQQATQRLEQLMESDMGLQEAWYPKLESIGTPCGALMPYPALVVELGTTDAADLDGSLEGFISEPGKYNLNCGVTEFQHYTFGS